MFFLSWRQLMANKKQTLLILLGISFGTLLFVSISGVQLGFRRYISEQLLNNTAHVLISGAESQIVAKDVTDEFYADGKVLWVVPPSGKRREARLENYQGWYERLSVDPDVVDFAPRLTANALLSNGDFTTSVGLNGTLPEKQMRISSVEKYMKQGSLNDLRGGGNRIVIGSGVAQNLGVRVGSTIQVSGGRGQGQPYRVVGLVHFGNKQVDDAIAFAHLKNVQILAHSPGRVSSIAVALTDIDKSTDIADFWQSIGRDKVEDWQEANRMFMEMIRVQDFVRYFITGAILIVAAFGIYNVLTIMINQKRREIAILRAIGFAPKRIMQLILYQGLVMGLVGGVLGLVMGYGLLFWVESLDFGFEIGGSNHMLISYDTHIYVTAFVTANVASLFASYLPAWQASRLTPMDIIRSE